jgi:hypothetical protein
VLAIETRRSEPPSIGTEFAGTHGTDSKFDEAGAAGYIPPLTCVGAGTAQILREVYRSHIWCEYMLPAKSVSHV